MGPRGILLDTWVPRHERPHQRNLQEWETGAPGANISLLQDRAPAQKAPTQTSAKTVTQPNGTLLTTDTLLLMLNKLPATAQIAHRSPGISNNLLAASELVDAGCEIFFHSTGCEVTHNGEIILRGWRDPTTRLWRVSLIPDSGNTIFPPYSTIDDLYETPDNIQALSLPTDLLMYKHQPTHQLLPCNHGLSSRINLVQSHRQRLLPRVERSYIGQSKEIHPPSSPSKQGHMDQRRAYIRSTTQSPNTPPTTTDHMTAHPQAPNNDKTNVVYISTIGLMDNCSPTKPSLPSHAQQRHRSELLKAYTRVYQFFRTRGHRPQLHRLDNETIQGCRKTSSPTTMPTLQYTPPDMHRTNIAERSYSPPGKPLQSHPRALHAPIASPTGART
eukprot:CCRYP_020873-RA/>CCRYP_020873-RA protein AED:0.26 eAED:0.26 QI:0/0/0/1/1/1/3/0/386